VGKKSGKLDEVARLDRDTALQQGFAESLTTKRMEGREKPGLKNSEWTSGNCGAGGKKEESSV